MHVTVVTITYGRRWHLLRQTLHAALENGADQAIVVDNEAADVIGPQADCEFPGKVHTVRLSKNQGSSGAYSVGLQTALADGAEYLLLLDDDNRVASDAVTHLKRAYQSNAQRGPRNDLGVVAFRPSHQPEIFRGGVPDPLGRSNNSFFGFHLKGLCGQILKRLSPRRDGCPEEILDSMKASYSLRVCPFGGLFLHVSVIERHGFPDSRFVLYQDDTEFTSRITSSGGQLILVPCARIDDIEESWHTSRAAHNSFDRWLLLGSSKQVYYTARNWAYLQTRRCTHRPVLYMNKVAYLFLMWAMAVRRHKTGRFHLIVRAIRDGEKGLLGVSAEFPPAS